MNRKRFLWISLSVLFVALVQQSQVSYAQERAALEEVVVTGSRIVRKELEGSAPVQTFTREDIEASGQMSLGDIIREIPSVSGQAQTTQVNNGGTGAKTISLRGLGSDRTLVLLNGRRLPNSALSASSTGIVGNVDLNTIPVSMVERVEVLKEGASAVYGADAISGVVNIITRDDLDGLEVNASYGESGEGDGESQELSVTFGNSFDGGHFMFDATYVEEKSILAGDREWAATPLASLDGEVAFLGSSAPPWGNYTIPSTETAVTLGPEFGEFREFSFFGGDSYNFAPVNYQRQPNERWMLTFDGEQQLLDDNALGVVNVFAEAQYINRQNEQALAEVPLAPLVFFGFSDAPYSADNFYNPFDEQINDWRRRMVEGGPRIRDFESQTKRIVLGLNGQFEEWSWEAYYQYGDVSLDTNFGDLYNLQRVANAVGPTTGSPAGGDLQCVNDPMNCVPLDVFGQNSVTQDMLDYVTFTTNEAAGSDQEIFALNVSNSNIFDLPAGPVGVAFGLQQREESGFDNPDSQVAALAAANAVTGTPRIPTSGSYEVKEAYVEFLIPLLSDLPMVQSLDLELAHRYSDYDTFGSTNNSKVGARWRLNNELMIRGSFSEAFRQPQISDLFGGAGTSFPQISDPCAENPTDTCLADGVPAGGYEPPSTQIQTRVGGNENLEPETADIVTVGFVFEPRWVEGASLTADYYDIEITDAISTLGAEFVLTQCQQTGAFCGQIQRFDPASGGVVGFPRVVDNRFTNVGGVETSGVDLGLAYRGIETEFGLFDASVEATYIDKYDKIQADGSVIPHAGRFLDDQDGWFGRWKTNFSLRWNWRGWSANYQARWIKSAEESYQDQITGEVLDRTVDGRTYHDLQGGYRFPDSGLSVRVGVNNLTDKEPPLSLDGFNDNTDVRTFDTVGRFFYGELRYQM